MMQKTLTTQTDLSS